ncbi:MAG: hypothetical protein ACE5NG_08710 [bacterium]
MLFRKILSAMIDKPYLAILPFLALLFSGMFWKVGLLVSAAFLYQGAWCTYRHKRCGTPHCGVTGPLYLLIAIFSLLRWVPLFASSALSWSSWDHLFLVFWVGTTTAFAAQWLASRSKADLAYTAAFLATSLFVYAAY